MSYVDGIVFPIPKKNAAAYRKVVKQAAKLWIEYGALSYFECIGDGIQPGKLTSFPQAVMLQDDEVPWFSWIVFASKKERNRITKLVMADPRGVADLDSAADSPFAAGADLDSAADSPSAAGADLDSAADSPSAARAHLHSAPDSPTAASSDQEAHANRPLRSDFGSM